MNIKVLSVTSLSNYIKKLIDADFVLQNIKVQGEISNFKAHSSGHLYFTLKDEGARINCVMFRQERQKLRVLPRDGDKVTVKGRVSIYAQGGSYQIYVEDLQGEGTGDLYTKFLEIKQRLADEGLFDERNRRPIPVHPEKIAVITSPTGAAIRDIIKVLKTRNPGQSLVIYPVSVQGEASEGEVLKAMAQVNLRDDLSTLILARGGGSIEDLWSFNSEKIAYAIRASKIPVVTGIGHDIDFTIADFAADLRAATPSQAAELTIPNTSVYLDAVTEVRRRLHQGMAQRLRQAKTDLSMQQRFILQNDPRLIIINEIRTVAELRERLSGSMNRRMDQEDRLLERAKSLLMAYNPRNVLDKGYAIIQNESDEVLDSVSLLEQANIFRIRVKDGEVRYEKGDRIDGN
ncbi:MAG: exodeoxyribonuclease VII large subunit [Clostridiaceae bacterium]